MTIKKVISKLRDAGMRVTYKKRTDGGLTITSINGKKYAGRQGNVVARNITGDKLSARQVTQRIIGKQQAQEVAKRTREAFEKSGLKRTRQRTRLTKQLRSLKTRANKALRGTKGKTRVSTRKIKEALRRGESPASIASRLRETIRHAEGKAYGAERDFWVSYLKSENLGFMAKILKKVGSELTSDVTRRLRSITYSKQSKSEKAQEILDMFLEEDLISMAEYSRYSKMV